MLLVTKKKKFLFVTLYQLVCWKTTWTYIFKNIFSNSLDKILLSKKELNSSLCEDSIDFTLWRRVTFTLMWKLQRNSDEQGAVISANYLVVHCVEFILTILYHWLFLWFYYAFIYIYHFVFLLCISTHDRGFLASVATATGNFQKGFLDNRQGSQDCFAS